MDAVVDGAARARATAGDSGGASGGDIHVRADRLREQLTQLLAARTRPDHAARSAAAMVEADLMGIDSHGITLVPLYADLIGTGRIARDAEIRVAHAFGAIATIDGGGGFGHAPSFMAMDLAIEKARAFGIGAVGVRNSNHFGAAGVYALRAARAGMIGFTTSAVHLPSIVPVFGREPRLGTNPIAFAAPGAQGEPFLLDIATSTIAIGKLKLAARAGSSLPEGWALDRAGNPQNDPAQALVDRLMTPLGGTRAMGGHKGYGLAAMVEVLSSLLPGASFAPLRAQDAERYDVGHFHLAIHPEAFRPDGGFGADVDAFVACLRETAPAAGHAGVLAPGDPEHATRAIRVREGIPVPRSLARRIEEIAQGWDIDFRLEDPAE